MFEIVVYKDKELLLLKQLFDFLKQKKERLFLEKQENLGIIDSFHREYEYHLGDILNSILQIKRKLNYKIRKKRVVKIESFQYKKESIQKKYKNKINIQQKLKSKLSKLKKDDKEYFEVYQNLKNLEIEIENLQKEEKSLNQEIQLETQTLHKENIDFEELEKEYKEFEEVEKNEINKKELRNIYKKATKLCHPDIVKGKEEVFKILNESYQNNDIELVKEIFENLNVQKVINSKSNKKNKISILKKEIQKLKKEIKNLKNDIQNIKQDEVFEIKKQYPNLGNFFAILKEDLQNEFETLKQNLLIKRGEQYEYFIGEFYEENQFLVIYNGLIKSYEDKGVDIVVIDDNYVKIIQCKNWNDRKLSLENIENIYLKLSNYRLDIFDIKITTIQKYQQIKRDKKTIKKTIDKLKFKNIKMEKILYLSSENIISMEIGKYLKLIDNKQFLYKDMKIIIQEIY